MSHVPFYTIFQSLFKLHSLPDGKSHAIRLYNTNYHFNIVQINML